MKPRLPTYATSAALLERQNGAGWRLLGWTGLRAALISVPMLAVGVDARRAARGSLLASSIITAVAVFCLNDRG